MEVKPHISKGTPALAWYLGIDIPYDHSEDTVCRVGNSLKPGRLLGGSRNPVTDGGVDFGRDGSAQNVGAPPGRDLRCAEERGKCVLPRARML